MFIIIGYIIVFATTLGGFMLAGGKPLTLLHLSEITVILGVSLGVFVISSSKADMAATFKALLASLKGDGPGKKEYTDLLKMLYEMFITARKYGLVALDEHISEPTESAILGNYPEFTGNAGHIEFLVSNLRPVIDGKVKQEELAHLMEEDVKSVREEGHGPCNALHLLADSLPGIGICAAVLGIIVTMGVLDKGAGAVGYKVAAALTGTFMGVWFAYGFIGPLGARLHNIFENEATYYAVMAKAISGYAGGQSPIMACECARRAIPKPARPTADELEKLLKGE